MAECKVLLDNYHTGYYYPGNQIQGRVILNFNNEIKFRNVKLRLYGHEHTEWSTTERYTETRTRRRKTRLLVRKGDNDFLFNEIILFAPGTSGTTTLPAGQHIYPFSFTLPLDIPATCIYEYGSILYKLQAVVDRPMAFDYRDEQVFVVATIVDLNKLQSQELLEPTTYSNNKTLYCCLCTQGSIDMDVHLPKRTLVTDEIVKITARISNMSNRNIEGVELKLKQRIICKLNDISEASKAIQNEVIHIRENPLGAHGEDTYVFQVKLPSSFSIPNFTLCKLFKVSYYYSVLVKLPGVHKNLKVKMYPELGHIDIDQRGLSSNYPYPIDANMPMPYTGQASHNSGFQGEEFHPPQVNTIIPTPQSSAASYRPPMDLKPDIVNSIPEDLPPSYDSIHPPKKY